MNDAFQEYKRQYDECRVYITDDMPEEGFDLDLIELELTDHIETRKYSRAKQKQETMKLIKEYERGE